jgi:hypothetical protein
MGAGEPHRPQEEPSGQKIGTRVGDHQWSVEQWGQTVRQRVLGRLGAAGSRQRWGSGDRWKRVRGPMQEACLASELGDR